MRASSRLCGAWPVPVDHDGEFADPNSIVGYTFPENHSSFPEELLELGENVFQVHVHGVPEKTNPAFPDNTNQLPSSHKLSCRSCWTSLFAITPELHKMPENTGTVY